MKIILVTPYFHPNVGGVEEYVLSVATGLQKKGWEVIIVTSSDKIMHIENRKIHSFSTYLLPVSFIVSNTPINFWWSKELKHIFSTERPDLINAHTPVPYLADMAVRVASKMGIPNVLTYHNDLIKNQLILNMVIQSYYLLLGNKTIKEATRIITTSLHYAKTSNYLKPYQNKVEVIPPGVHEIKKIPSIKYTKNEYLLFVGTLDKTHRHKGLDYLIEAISKLPSDCQKLRLVVAGRGDDIAHYRSLAFKHKVNKRIIFTGFVESAQLAALYKGALCLCLPSITAAEGFGMVIIEAALYGTPSIGSNIGGIHQSIIDKQTGILVEPRNSDDLAKSIGLLYADKKMRNELGVNAASRVTSEFMWDIQVTKTDKLFRQLIK